MLHINWIKKKARKNLPINSSVYDMLYTAGFYAYSSNTLGLTKERYTNANTRTISRTHTRTHTQTHTRTRLSFWVWFEILNPPPQSPKPFVFVRPCVTSMYPLLTKACDTLDSSLITSLYDPVKGGVGGVHIVRERFNWMPNLCFLSRFGV